MSFLNLIFALQVPLGIGLVIFVHELGHFLAARWCGARVEVFSLGFGPKLFGVKRGDTLFQVAAVPLGGFVKVAGEYHDGTTPKEEGTLSSLSVWQRFLYYSGGVIMNVVFALIVMPLVIFAGVPTTAPIVAAPSPGMPAWRAGVEEGSEILAINDEEITDFEHLVIAVAVNGKDDVELVARPPGEGATPVTYRMTPEYDEEVGLYRLGLSPGLDPTVELVITPDSPASAAGLVTGDRLLGVEGQPTELSAPAQLQRAAQDRGPITLRVARPVATAEAEAAPEPRAVTIEPKVEPQLARGGKPLVGIGPVVTTVAELRALPGAGAWVAALGLQEGDVVLDVNGSDVFGPSWVEDALLAMDPGAALTLGVWRGDAVEELTVELPPGARPLDLADAIAFEMDAGTSVVVDPASGSAVAMAGMVSGDRILNVNGTACGDWDQVLEPVRAATKADAPIEFVLERYGPDATRRDRMQRIGAANERMTVTGGPLLVADYGLNLRAATMVLQEDSFGAAIVTGTQATKRFLIQVYLQLKKMIFSDEISAKNLGGIISIGAISYETASQGLAKFFFFLALLSVNLAIINLVPIPILDGGHLFFLLIEAVKGSPVSERAFGYSQVVGLVVIMSLMVYVTYQDIVRWVLS